MDFFNRVFGGETRKDVAEHVEIIDNGKGGLESLFPRREYVTMDAERLIGAQVMSEPMTVYMDHHTLTILSAVRDENAPVVEMTPEDPDGENAPVFSRLLNEEKGAYFADEAEIFFRVERAAEMMWADMEGSMFHFSWRQDFDERYLASVRFICLAMSERYIDHHFGEIIGHESETETRLVAADCTMNALKSDKKNIVSGFQDAGEQIVPIDTDYEQTTRKSLDRYHHFRFL